MRDELSEAERAVRLISEAPGFVDVPTIVLTGSHKKEGPGWEAVWRETQERLAWNSSDRRQVLTQAGHYVHRDEPELVLQSIAELVEKARALHRARYPAGSRSSGVDSKSLRSERRRLAGELSSRFGKPICDAVPSFDLAARGAAGGLMGWLASHIYDRAMRGSGTRFAAEPEADSIAGNGC